MNSDAIPRVFYITCFIAPAAISLSFSREDFHETRSWLVKNRGMSLPDLIPKVQFFFFSLSLCMSYVHASLNLFSRVDIGPQEKIIIEASANSRGTASLRPSKLTKRKFRLCLFSAVILKVCDFIFSLFCLCVLSATPQMLSRKTHEFSWPGILNISGKRE